MNNKYLILDCFVDEPACFGVPPFISPYPRYVYGALLAAGIDESYIDYQTVDNLRNNNFELIDSYKMVFLIGGAIVPGKYLGYKIGTYSEILRIIKTNSSQNFAIGGLISHKLSKELLTNINIITKDIEQFAFSYANGKPIDQLRTYKDLNLWAKLGAKIVTKHPDYPDLIAEIETYRGCFRENHCSFCSEAIFKNTPFRDQQDILEEIDSLINCNINHYRIGRQADILAYKTNCNNYKNGFPEPNPEELEILFSELKKRKDNNKIKTLNIDNANPGTIVNYPDKSSRIIEAITNAITPGDTIPLGVESFDPNLIEKNNLKVNKDGLIQAVSIINEIGGKRIDGIPILLPGINLIQGLIGETKNTFKLNYMALKEIMDKGLLVKRINIRKLSPFPGTEISKSSKKASQALLNRYEFYKEKIRKEIDHYMLSQIYPTGTILKDVRIEDTRFDYSYGRQLASYAITIKIPEKLPVKSVNNIVVINQRERSLMGLASPIDINSIPQKALEMIPGISKNISSEMVLKRPFSTSAEIEKVAPSIDKNVLNNIKLP